MQVVVGYSQPVRGDDRFHRPGVPPKGKVPSEGHAYFRVPDALLCDAAHRRRAVRIGMVGSYPVGAEHRWACYYLHRDQRTFE